MSCEQPMRIHQLRRLAIDQRYAADFPRPLGMDHVVLNRREVEDLGESIADLVRAIAEPEQPHLIIAELRHIGAGERKDRLAKLNPELASSLLNGAHGHFLDAVDDREADSAASAIETAEQQHRGGSRLRLDRTFSDARGAFLRLELDPADLR